MTTNRILVVDDDPTVRDSLNDVLLAEGYFVIPAENGKQALEVASKSPVDLVLLALAREDFLTILERTTL